MWVLKSSRGELYYLLVGKDHSVGRRDGDLTLADDQSISRRHAVFTVEHNIKNLGDPSKLPVVTLTDMGSKYGTFVNEGIENSSRITSNCKQILGHGDHIRFGLQWNDWKLEYIPLVITTSTLTPEEKSNVMQNIVTLGGHIVNSWQDNITHVTMRNLTLTVKVVCALAHLKPIVTPQYWESYLSALSDKQPCPDSKEFIPPLAETTLNVNEVSFDVNENRKNLFVGKHFVFSSSHQYKAYSCMVTAAGAKADILDENGMTHEDLAQSHVVVVQYSFNRMSQESQMPQSFQDLIKYLKSRGKRVIPESDIGLAILHCSIERHCNPDYNVASALIPRESRDLDNSSDIVLALDTQESENFLKRKRPERNIVIPESGVVGKPVSSGDFVIPTSSVDNKESAHGKDDAITLARIKKERLSITDEVDTALNPRKRFRSLMDDGFLSKKTAIPGPSNRSQIVVQRVKFESVAKSESDDEDLFDLPSEKKAKQRRRISRDEEERDMFYFAEEKKPKALNIQKDKTIESTVFSKKRKSTSNDICETSSFSKRHIMDEDVQEHDAKPVKHVITLDGFLGVDQKRKDNAALDESMMNLAQGLKNVTVVEVKSLIPQHVISVTAHVSLKDKSDINFKKFRKVQPANHYPVIRSQDLVPCDINTKGLCKWLNETHAEDDEEDDNDWSLFELSQTNKKKTQVRLR